MLTPVFQLEQNDIYLIIKIRAPYCKLSDAEVSYGDKEFVFNASPYFLRLFLTGEVIDDETGNCEYDSDKGGKLYKFDIFVIFFNLGEFTICVPKKCRGEFLVLLSYTAPIYFSTIMNPNGTNDNSFERARRAESNELEINKFGRF